MLRRNDSWEPNVSDALSYSELQRRRGFSGNSSTGSDESCGAYLARKLQELEKAVDNASTLESTSTIKQSESEPLTVHPTYGTAVEETEEPATKPDPVGQVQSLSLAKFLIANIGASGVTSVAEGVTSSYKFTFAPALEHRSDQGEFNGRPKKSKPSEFFGPIQIEAITDSEMEPSQLSDQDSSRYARSTLADALAPPKKQTIAYSSGESDCESSLRHPKDPVRETSISITSREVIRKYFAETSPICLPQGHPTVAFNQDQMCHMLKVVADETATSTFELMNSVIQRLVN